MSINTYKFKEYVVDVEIEVASDEIRFLYGYQPHKKAIKGYTLSSNTYNCIEIDGDDMIELAC